MRGSRITDRAENRESQEEVTTISDEIFYTPATELASRIRFRELSPIELVDAFPDRIGRRNPGINAYVTLLGEEARERAREAERVAGSGGPLGTLHDVPIEESL